MTKQTKVIPYVTDGKAHKSVKLSEKTLTKEIKDIIELLSPDLLIVEKGQELKDFTRKGMYMRISNMPDVNEVINLETNLQLKNTLNAVFTEVLELIKSKKSEVVQTPENKIAFDILHDIEKSLKENEYFYIDRNTNTLIFFKEFIRIA